jgi:hypothetical protein
MTCLRKAHFADISQVLDCIAPAPALPAPPLAIFALVGPDNKSILPTTIGTSAGILSGGFPLYLVAISLYQVKDVHNLSLSALFLRLKFLPSGEFVRLVSFFPPPYIELGKGVAYA